VYKFWKKLELGHKITLLKFENSNSDNPEESDELKTAYQKD